MIPTHIFKIQGVHQHFSWGGTSFIPELFNLSNSIQQPFAEYWLGVHNSAPSKILNEQNVEVGKLNDFVAVLKQDFVEYKNHDVNFLFKLLDIRDMLSIQVHPSKQAAQLAFESENREHIALNAENRNFKDPNHKPEVAIALSDFFLLHGFKPYDELVNKLSTISELEQFVPLLQTKGLTELYKLMMGMPQQDVNKILSPLLDRIIPMYEQNILLKGDEDFWAARAAIKFNTPNKIDRGIFSIYLFNLLQLKKGEAIFQSPGMPHAYLEGQIIEVMSNSDNVLRGGLTQKHIDVKQFLKFVSIESVSPTILHPIKNNFESLYPLPVEDFKVSAYNTPATEKFCWASKSFEIIFLLEGNATIKSNEQTLKLSRGESIFVLPNCEIEIMAQSEVRFFRVGEWFAF